MFSVVRTSGGGLKDAVLDFLSSRDDKKVLDLGGGIAGFASAHVTHVADIAPRDLSSSEILVGDICSSDFWDRIPDKFFSVCVSTHTLEDIRDPVYVAEQMTRVADICFVEVPSLWWETGRPETAQFRGNCHHRWLTVANDDGVFFMMKSGLTWLSPIQAFVSVVRVLKIWKARRAWWTTFQATIYLNRRRARMDSSLRERATQVLWSGESPFRYWEADFAGSSIVELMTRTIALFEAEQVGAESGVGTDRARKILGQSRA